MPDHNAQHQKMLEVDDAAEALAASYQETLKIHQHRFVDAPSLRKFHSTAFRHGVEFAANTTIAVARTKQMLEHLQAETKPEPKPKSWRNLWGALKR